MAEFRGEHFPSFPTRVVAPEGVEQPDLEPPPDICLALPLTLIELTTHIQHVARRKQAVARAQVAAEKFAGSAREVYRSQKLLQIGSHRRGIVIGELRGVSSGCARSCW